MTELGGPAQWLSHHAKRRAGATALITDHEVLTFGEWHARSCALSAVLTRAGFVPGAVTAVLSASARRHVAWLTAGWQTGLPLLPLSAGRPDAPELVQRSGIRQVVIDAGVQVPDGLMAVSANLADQMMPAPKVTPAPRAPATGHEPLLYLASSGTSGPAKLAVFDAFGIAAAIRATCVRLDVRASDCWLACLPLQHVGGLATVLRALRAGAATVVMEQFDAEAVAGAFAAQAITHVSLVPAMLAALLDAGVAPPASLRCALIGGGALSATVRSRALARGWPVRISYGMTETFAAVAIHDGTSDWVPGDAGTPIDGIELDVIPGPGGVGRIRVRGPQLMRGYAGDRDGGFTDGAFVSADIGRVADDGHLRVLGRCDVAFTSGGLLVHPDRIEQSMAECPGVAAVVVVGVPDDRWEHRIVAVYAGDANATAVAEWCRLNVASAERPRDIIRWTGLPLAGPGKPDRAAVLRRLVSTPVVDSR